MSTSLMTLGQVAQWLAQSGQAVHAPVAVRGDPATPIARVHTDTRTIAAGDLFVALQGDNFDANALLHEAQAKGAVAVLCRTGLGASQLPPGLPRIEVADTLAALGQLARAWRQQFVLPLIAVTGSNGKTTVTQMIASILQAHAPGDASLATQGNLNNEIGVPLTLLRLRAHHHCAVVELGMNHPGEIAALAAMAQPTVGLVNNAQREHLEFMHTVDAVALENGAVLTALGPKGCAVFPLDDAYTGLWQRLAGERQVLGFGNAAAGDVVVSDSAEWRDGGWSVSAHATVAGHTVALRYRLAIAGQHNVRNSLAAAACALAAGIPSAAVERGLEAFVPVKGRSRAFALTLPQRSLTVVDDTYNANPDSVRAACDVLRDLPGPRLLVLGDMGEVGLQGPEFHAEAGSYAHHQGIERLLTVGELSQSAADSFAAAGGSAHHFATMDALCAALAAELDAAASVLVKGSRFMRMERAVAALQAIAAVPTPAPAVSTQGEAACC
ncbi:MAG: UDP-N-acetylmuramoyl-tripeptide--D-alanyl-D-alanine ligase [Rhodoferax sp.]|nr:UDP-N-acetylmuramoyl-tripeptide--D-alanyl-D-alanine ligase [Rhodoferax sp.]